MTFRTHFNKKKSVYDVIEQKEHELHDSLLPYSVSEQVERFTKAGLALEATRRKELASIRSDVDDPEDYETPLDKEHISPADMAEASRSYEDAIKQRTESAKNAEGSLPVGKSDESSGAPAEVQKPEHGAPEK